MSDLTDATGSAPTNFLFIDSRVPDLEALIAAAQPGVRVVLLDAQHDGVRQIAEALAGVRGVASISVVSHGDEGVILLGNGPLHGGNIDSHLSDLQAIGAALAADGDILLYGCDVGAGDAGAAFLATLARATGADVAASNDATGGGGDWQLEISTGNLDGAPVLRTEDLANYSFSLHTVSVSTVAALKAALATAAADGSDDVITLTGNLTFASAADAITINVTDGKTTTLVGGGFTIDGSNLARVLKIDGGKVALDNITIRNGFVTGNGGNIGSGTTGGAGGDALGAGIYNAGTLTITNSTITLNKAAAGGGGGSQVGGGGGAGGGGGGFGSTAGGSGGNNPPYTGGSGSAGTGGNGGGYGTLVGRGGTTSGGAGGSLGGYTNGGAGGTANNGTIAIGGGGGGAGYDGAGGSGGNAAGGIYNAGTLTITGSSVTNNIAAGGGGGGGAATGGSGGNGGNGGAGVGGIWNVGTLTLDTNTNSSLSTGNVGGAGSGGSASKSGSVNGTAGTATSTISTTGGGSTTVAPNGPGAPDMAAASDTGTLNTDDITGNTTPTFTGTATAGATVTLYDTDGTTVLGTATATGGTWTITSSTLSEGLHTITAKQTVASVTSLASSALAVTIDTTGPTVSGVTSSTANGSYKAGDVIAVQVNFSEAVTVTGTPQLTLETGASDRVVDYAGGSGSSTLTFTYTVQAGDTSSDLDYIGAAALALNGGTIRDAAGNDATLTLPTPGAANSLGANKNIVIDTVAPTVSGVTSSTANGAYKSGDVISVQVNFSEAVTVTGTPQLTLETGATDRVINYASGSGGSTLTFTYTVQAGDASSDLDYIGTGALALNGGTIKDAAGNNATLTLAVPGVANSLGANKNLVIDAVAPTVSGVSSSTANGAYKTGDVISIQVNFSEAVTVTGTPQLTLETGLTDRTVNYAGGSGTSTLTFSYTVQAGDTAADLDYIGTSALALNGGTIKDAAGNNATLTLAAPGAANSLGANKDIVVDTTVPTVSGVTSTTANGAYNAGDVISIAVNFSEAVTVTGTPQITLETGATDRVVNYTSGSGTSTLVFNYTVQAGDSTSDLDYISSAALALNGGTIKDAAGNNATLTLAAPGTANSLGANKAIVIDTVAPVITNVSSSAGNGTYTEGDLIVLSVAINEATNIGGTPQLQLETGATDRVINMSGYTILRFFDGTGNSTLFFTYTVQAGDSSADLDYLSSGAFSVNGGYIRDDAGNDLVLTLPAPGAAGSLGANKNLVIDAIQPAVVGVSSSTANGTYKVGDVVSIQVTFSEAVDVTGTPQLKLETGSTDRAINYTSGTGTTTLTFSYTVQAGDLSSDLDYFSTGALTLNGGTIKDTQGNSAVLTLPTPGAANSLGANKALVIDGVLPTVSGVTSSTANGAYKVGDVLSIQVGFSEAVLVTGTPQLTLETGAVDRTINYAGGSGTSTLSFTYTVQAGDTSADLDFISTSALALNGGTIRDAAGNNATLTLPTPGATGSLGANKNLVIDTTAPVVSSVASATADGTYKVGDVISLQVNLSEAVTVTGTPQLTLETGTTDRVVNYASGSGTSTLTFTYTVQAGDSSADLDYIGTGALALNGGTIRDAAGNDATLTLPTPGAAGSLGANQALVIDGIAPTVTGVTSGTTDGTYKLGDVITVEVNFSEAVTVAGTPQLTLETGATDRAIDYVSGSGTSTLTFSYTVQAGDSSADLDYLAAGALALNGGSIQDGAGNNATLTLPAPGAANSLGANKNLVVDGVVPVVNAVTSSTPDGLYKAGDTISLQVVLSEAVTVTGVPQLTLETGSVDRVVNYVSGSGTNTLTFNYTVQAGDETADLDYLAIGALDLNGGSIRDGAGNDATLTLPAPGAAGSLGANKALVIDGAPPVFVYGVVGGESVVLVYSDTRALDAVNVPGPGAFVVMANGSPVGVSGVSVDAQSRTVVLTLDRWVMPGVSVTVAYTDPTGGDDLNAIQDAAGNDAASTGIVVLENRSVQPTPDPAPNPGPTPQPEPRGVTKTAPPEGGEIWGTPYDDDLRGQGGNDIIHPLGSADLVNGGGGFDVVVFEGLRRDYAVSHTAEGYLVRSLLDPKDRDTLVNVERLRFSDMSINLGVGDAADGLAPSMIDKLVELYIGYVGRVPDADGMSYWIGRLAAGASLAEIGEGFYAAAIHFSALTGYSSDMSDAAFVDRVYRHVLGRNDPDAEGLAFWTARLTEGGATRGTLVGQMVDSAHSFKGHATYGYVADLLDNKIEVGKTFAISMGLVHNRAEDSITEGMRIAEAVTPTDADTAIGLVGVADGFSLY